MPTTTVVVGLLLMIQGVGFYFGTGAKSVTALIPTFVGLPLLLLGLLAMKESVRRHAMHAASALALLGLLAAVGRMVSAGLSLSPAGVSVLILALLAGGFLILCIRSFVAARRRQAKPAP